MAKEELTVPCLLVHFDQDQELCAFDASPYGVRAVLTHRMDDGTDKLITFTFRSIAPAERNYAQLDKEALAMGK